MAYTVGQKRICPLPNLQVVPLKKMRDVCNVLYRYTSIVKDKMEKKERNGKTRR